MNASLSDILTAAKNLVTATNDQARQSLLLAGTEVFAGITGTTVAATGQGRIVMLSVVLGAAGGFLYDNSIPGTGYPLCAIPATAGVYYINLPFNNGLFVAPGAGSIVTVSYSLAGTA
jgi:hypothetical protein